MTLSSMVLSRDWQEVGVLECILGGLHIDVDIESDPQRAQAKLAKHKIDALIVDTDLNGTSNFLRGLRDGKKNSVPLVIVSGSTGRERLEATGANFVFEKPISVGQAVHILSAARNVIMDGRLRYYRQSLHLTASLQFGSRKRLKVKLTNVSQGGVGIHLPEPLDADIPVLVDFKLPGIGPAVRFGGEIAWTDDCGNVGIRCVDIEEPVKRDLQLWLEQQYFSSRSL